MCSFLICSFIDYKINLPNDSKIFIRFNRELVESDWRFWEIELYNSTFEPVASFSVIGGDMVAVNSSSYGLRAGNYYIKVSSGLRWSSATYDFTVKSSKTNAWEKEFNNSYDMANSIKLGEKVNGSLMSSSDKDVYKVTINKTQKVRIRFNRKYIENAKSLWKVTLYDNNYRELKTMSVSGGNTSNQYSETVAVKKGTYYLTVTASWWFSSTDYALTLMSAPDYSNRFGHKESEITISRISNRTYTGKRITPSLVVKKGSARLKKGRDYTVTYSSNVYPGKAKVVVRGKGKYSGVETTSFYIVPRKAQIT